MDDQVFIIRTTGETSSKRRWFVYQDWAEQFYSDCVESAKPGQVVELIQMDMDQLIDFALDGLLDGPFTDGSSSDDYRVLERHNA